MDIFLMKRDALIETQECDESSTFFVISKDNRQQHRASHLEKKVHSLCFPVQLFYMKFISCINQRIEA